MENILSCELKTQVAISITTTTTFKKGISLTQSYKNEQ